MHSGKKIGIESKLLQKSLFILRFLKKTIDEDKHQEYVCINKQI